jgi:hypothetical protein
MPGSKLFVAQRQCSLLQLYGAPPSGRSHGGRYPMTRIYGHCWRGSSRLRRAHAGNWTRPAADTFRSAYSGIPEKAQRSGYLEGPNVVSAAHCTTLRRRSSTSAIASKCNARVMGGTERMEHRRCTNCDSVAVLISTRRLRRGTAKCWRACAHNERSGFAARHLSADDTSLCA